jgi:hypothetical protein
MRNDSRAPGTRTAAHLPLRPRTGQLQTTVGLLRTVSRARTVRLLTVWRGIREAWFHGDYLEHAPLPVSPSRINPAEGQMIKKVIRCPYCVAGSDFKEMVVHLDGRMICRKCGHMVIAADPDFKCSCPKCQEMRYPAGVRSSRAS